MFKPRWIQNGFRSTLLILSFSVMTLTATPSALAVLLQGPDVSNIEFEGVARALQEKTWIEAWKDRQVMSFEEVQNFQRLLADVQREWITQEKSSVGSREWPKAQALFDLVSSQFVDSNHRSESAEAFFRIGRRMAESDRLSSDSAKWLGRALSNESKLQQEIQAVERKQGLSIPRVQIGVDTLKSQFHDWDEIWIDGKPINTLSDLIVTKDRHWIELISNRYRTVRRSVEASEISTVTFPRDPWLAQECKNGETIELNLIELRAGGVDSQFVDLYKNKTLTLVGPSMCLMSLASKESSLATQTSSSKRRTLSSDGATIKDFGVNAVNEPLSNPRETISNRTLWIGAGVAVLAAGLYAVLRSQNQSAPPPTQSEGF